MSLNMKVSLFTKKFQNLLGNCKLEHDPQEDTECDNAQDDPDDHKVSRTTAKAMLLLSGHGRSLVAVLTLSGRKLAGGAVFTWNDQYMINKVFENKVNKVNIAYVT